MNTIATWVRRHSWLSSVAAFGILFAGADAVQQRFLGPPPPPSHHQRPPHHPDGARTARAALLGLAFHGNFNYVWLRGLERAIPGSAARAVVVKVLADQTVAGPITISAFFTGMSLLEGKPDIFKDLRQKFWPTYKTGVVYWSAMQITSRSPPAPRRLRVTARQRFLVASLPDRHVAPNSKRQTYSWMLRLTRAGGHWRAS
ncbi:mpv17-like protein isoform X2 [Lethenteron reissneri]|uniref:mpv17-like protein isoform X2 n=1 Tax=Lethenteron reissneri TaxID=7753 RepID=UPI002AB7D961|nr:mpv17-like protein isoform X2 [Lethenteron reissneri]